MSDVSAGTSASANKGPLEILSEEKKAHEERLSKMQDDMQKVFEQKVAEKERRLKMKEEEMMKQHEDMRKNLEAQRAALAAARDQHERSLRAWTESQAAADSQTANQNSATINYGGEGDGSNNYGTLVFWFDYVLVQPLGYTLNDYGFCYRYDLQGETSNNIERLKL